MKARGSKGEREVQEREQESKRVNAGEERKENEMTRGRQTHTASTQNIYSSYTQMDAHIYARDTQKRPIHTQKRPIHTQKAH